MDENKFDGFDGIMVVTGIIITASAPTLLVALPLAVVGAGLHYLRRNAQAAQWGNNIAERYPIADYVVPKLLPGPKNTDMIVHPTKAQKTAPVIQPIDTVDNDKRRWSDRITQPLTPIQHGGVPEIQTSSTRAMNEKPAKISTAQNMEQVLAIMPKRIPYNHPKLPDPPTPTSVLIGYDPIGRKWVWADFGISGDTIHAFIAGQTRAGKDSQIRLWFTQLTSENDPEDVQFVIIDAKGEWVTPALADSRHMAVPPVGGFDLLVETDERGKRKLRDKANERIEEAIIDTIQMLKDRADEFKRVGATNLQSYTRKTGRKLPLLFIVVTDVGTNLQGILEQLINFLVLKGGSLGVRAIVSMQTASGEDTSWRGQMGLTLSGYQGQSSADAPNLGIPVRAMKYRPSELPSVDVPENRGLFVVRKGIEQYVVRGAHLPDEIFEEYCEVHLPRKSIATDNELLASMLFAAPAKPKTVIVNNKPVVVQPKRILTKDQAIKAAEYAAQGIAPGNITKILGFTSPKRYAEVKPVVEAIVKAVKVAQAQKGNTI